MKSFCLKEISEETDCLEVLSLGTTFYINQRAVNSTIYSLKFNEEKLSLDIQTLEDFLFDEKAFGLGVNFTFQLDLYQMLKWKGITSNMEINTLDKVMSEILMRETDCENSCFVFWETLYRLPKTDEKPKVIMKLTSKNEQGKWAFKKVEEKDGLKTTHENRYLKEEHLECIKES